MAFYHVKEQRPKEIHVKKFHFFHEHEAIDCVNGSDSYG